MNIDTVKEAVVSPEIDRLLIAAVVSDRFRELLLKDPLKAVRKGYQGEFFHLSDRELACLREVSAFGLADFSAQVIANLHNFPPELPISAGTMVSKICSHEEDQSISLNKLYI